MWERFVTAMNPAARAPKLIVTNHSNQTSNNLEVEHKLLDRRSCLKSKIILHLAPPALSHALIGKSPMIDKGYFLCLLEYGFLNNLTCLEIFYIF
jgi:hypothetical protein